MTYEKHEWVTGEVITADKLNNMETGIESVSAESEALSDEIENKANINGTYIGMTVGNAEQLVSTQFVEDSEPYLFRTSGGSADIGNREYDEIVGGSIVWNQRLSGENATTTTSTKHGVQVTPVGNQFMFDLNGTFEYTGGDRNLYVTSTTISKIPVVSTGHKYLLTNTSTLLCVYVYSYSSDGITFTGNRVNVSNQQGIIVTPNKDGKLMVSLSLGSNIASGTVIDERIEVNMFDLTQMFGSAVADYLYSLEQSSAGAGVTLFRNWFPNDYYEYDEGTLMHVSGLEEHKMTGFNQWDEEWEVGYISVSTGANIAGTNNIRSKNYIPCFPNTTYYYRNPYPAGRYSVLLWYDADKNYLLTYKQVIQNNTFTTPANCYYMRFYVFADYGTTYNNDICINLSWSGYRNGEYEPYTEFVDSLDSTLILRGVPKVTEDGKIYYDGDVYRHDGTVTRKYGIREYQSGDESLSDVITDGTNTVYELEAPSEETAVPYTSPQIVNDFGTEEYVTDSIVPVGHNTKYPANLRDKLQHLPDLADSDGYYLIQQASNDMSLVLFRIPQAPTTDGTYILKATVSGGTPTYTWESET